MPHQTTRSRGGQGDQGENSSVRITDKAERRRTQNRISQRNHRKKVKDEIARLEERVVFGMTKALAAESYSTTQDPMAAPTALTSTHSSSAGYHSQDRISGSPAPTTSPCPSLGSSSSSRRDQTAVVHGQSMNPACNRCRGENQSQPVTPLELQDPSTSEFPNEGQGRLDASREGGCSPSVDHITSLTNLESFTSTPLGSFDDNMADPDSSLFAYNPTASMTSCPTSELPGFLPISTQPDSEPWRLQTDDLFQPCGAVTAAPIVAPQQSLYDPTSFPVDPRPLHQAQPTAVAESSYVQAGPVPILYVVIPVPPCSNCPSGSVEAGAPPAGEVLRNPCS